MSSLFTDNCFLTIPENWDLLQYPFTRESTPGRIRDIQDSEMYRKLARTAL